MLTTEEGHCYGEKLGEYQIVYADWIRTQAGSWQRNKENNPGRKKYYAKKRRYKNTFSFFFGRNVYALISITVGPFCNDETGGIFCSEIRIQASRRMRSITFVFF